jgi:hypothetical protein
VARSAEHEVHVEQNPIGAYFLCTLHQKFQFNGNRMGAGRRVFLVFFPVEMGPFTAVTIHIQGFDTFKGKNGHYNTNPVFEDILSMNRFQTFSLIIYGIKHITR